MRKTGLFRLVLILMVIAAGVGCSEKKPPIAVPQNITLFGFTEAGIFFIHNTLLENIEAKTIALRSQTSDFRARDMERKGDFWVYDVSSHREDSEMFKMYRDFPILYYFEGDNRQTIPNDLMKYDKLFDSDILRIKNKLGYVFYTEPIEKMP
ncbi:MAG: hypothetical protein AB1921_03455 [Thermodesulfobacteriota bacterium]